MQTKKIEKAQPAFKNIKLFNSPQKPVKKWLIVLILALIAIPGATAIIYVNNETAQLKKQIGQMLIVGFRGTHISNDSSIAKQISQLNLGGIILFDYDAPSKSYPRNITNPSQTQQLIANLKNYAPTPLFIAVDAEGGLINRLKPKYGFASFPSAQELGNANDLSQTQNISDLLGQELSMIGFNLNFAPVVDVNINPQNPVIGKLERSFSGDPQIVTDHALAFIRGQHQNNIATAIKHFPGHGSSQNDSHLGMVDITNTYQPQELEPFKNIIAQNQADMVMTAHIINASIDPEYPATLSPKFLQDVLRKQLGYQGIIVSDDMQMGAIVKNYGFQEALIRTINAGCDILILSNNGESYDDAIAQKASDIIIQAVKNGRISHQRIEESYDRIESLKKKYQLIKN